MFICSEIFDDISYSLEIIQLIKTKAKVNKKEITKEEAEKILKLAHDHKHSDLPEKKKEQKSAPAKKTSLSKKAKSPGKKTTKAKKVSKK